MSRAPPEEPKRSYIACVDCQDDPYAAAMIVHADGNAHPYCEECVERQVSQGGLEYPLYEFYDFVGGSDTSLYAPGPHSVEIFESGSEGNPDAWLEAQNLAYDQPSYVRLSDMI